MEYFKTGRGNQGLRINNFIYKRHYETANSVYYICTLSNKLRCKQRVIAEKDKPYSIRFKGKEHNHGLLDYSISTKQIPTKLEPMDTLSLVFEDHKV